MTRSKIHPSNVEPIGQTPNVASEKPHKPTPCRLDFEDLYEIQKMLVLGLSCYAEVSRVRDQADAMKVTRRLVDESLLPLDPAGYHAVADFGIALTLVNGAMFKLASGAPR